MAACAIHASVPTLTVIAEGSAARPTVGFLLIAAGRLTLLREILRTALVVEVPTILLISIRTIRLVGRTVVCQSAPIRIAVLRLVVFGAEIRRRKIRAASIGVEIVGAIVVPVDVICVDVVAIDVVYVHVAPIVVVAVVIVVPVHERIGIGHVDITVVDDCGVVPATSPGIPTPSAATVVRDRCTDRDTHAK